MNKKTALLALLSLASIVTYAERPWASVNELVLVHKFNPKWKMLSTSRVRFGEDFNTFNMWFADAGLYYRFHKNFDFGAAFRYLEYRIADEWVGEYRPMIQGHFYAKPFDISIRNRCRLEFREYDFNRDDDHRFRNQLRAEFPWGIGPVKPYLEDEIFYGFNAEKINTNWLTGGIYFKPGDKTKMRLAYRWNAVRKSSGEWVSANELYLALIQSF